MRSRYSAFAKGLDSYLRYSWHPRQLPDEVTIDARQVWTALRILSTSGGKAGDDHGTVEFEATCEVDGRCRVLHEVSGFARFEGRWVYTEPVDANRSDPARG